MYHQVIKLLSSFSFHSLWLFHVDTVDLLILRLVVVDFSRYNNGKLNDIVFTSTRLNLIGC